jgi:hypothetical protein
MDGKQPADSIEHVPGRRQCPSFAIPRNLGPAGSTQTQKFELIRGRKMPELKQAGYHPGQLSSSIAAFKVNMGFFRKLCKIGHF